MNREKVAPELKFSSEGHHNIGVVEKAKLHCPALAKEGEALHMLKRELDQVEHLVPRYLVSGGIYHRCKGRVGPRDPRGDRPSWGIGLSRGRPDIGVPWASIPVPNPGGPWEGAAATTPA